jgi:hypothetical protein
MAVPYVKQTWTDGSGGATPVSAARLNYVEQGIEDAHKMPCARVYHSATQTASNGLWTALAFNSERFDVDGLGTSTIHDNTTNNSRLTCRVAGVYLITGHCQLDSTAGGTQRYLHIMLNGTTDIAGGGLTASAFSGSIGTDDAHLHTSTVYKLAVNDYVQLRVFHDCGADRNIDSLGNWSPEFMMVRVASG